MHIYVPGSYNNWDAADPGVKAEKAGKTGFVLRRHLDRGIHRFKLVADGAWDRNWGSAGTELLVAPTEGDMVPSGDDVVLNVPEAGTAAIHCDPDRARWWVELVPDGSGLEGALTGKTTDPRVQELLQSLSGFNGSSLSADTLRALLAWGGPEGVLPARSGERVLFVWQGPGWDLIHLAPSWRGWGQGLIPLGNIPGTDIHGTIEEAPNGVHPYKMVVNGRWQPDPSNRWITPDGIPIPMFQVGSFNSVLAIHAAPLDSGSNLLWYPNFQSAVRHNARDVFVWLPPSYLRDPQRRYRTLYMLDGNEAVTRNFSHEMAADLMRRGQAEDAIIVFVAFADNAQRMYEFFDPVGREAYSQFFVRELVPYIDGQFRTQRTPEARAITGVSLGGNFSYYLAWKYSSVFGGAAGQGVSWYYDNSRTLQELQTLPPRPIRLYVDSAYATYGGAPDDSGDPSRRTVKLLRQWGYDVHHVERENQPHDWPSWRERFPELIRWFAPARVGQPR